MKRSKITAAVAAIATAVVLAGGSLVFAATSTHTSLLSLGETNANVCSSAAAARGGTLSIAGNSSAFDVTCDTAAPVTTTTAPATSTTGSVTTTTGVTTTTAVTTTVPSTTGTTAAASGQACTNPNWSTSEATGTDNIDGPPQYWWIDNDAWSGSHGPQTLNVCAGSPTSSDSNTSWYAVSNQTDNGGQVETYPNTEYDVGGRASPSTTPISAYNAITSTFSEDYPRQGSWDAAYDMWTNNWGTETMIWNDALGDPTYWETQGTPVTIDGVAYQFVNLGSEFIFIMKNPESSGTVNILAVYQYEVAQGLAKASDVISQLEYGVEIEATQGTETFPMNGVSFNLS